MFENYAKSIIERMRFFWRRRFQLQKYYLRFLGARVGINNNFYDWLHITGPISNLRIGNSNHFNPGIFLVTSAQLDIGNENHFSVGVKILTTRLDSSLKNHLSFPITIGNYNWLAADSMVSISDSRIDIATGIILGAKSMLCSSATSPGLYVGVPAKLKSSN